MDNIQTRSADGDTHNPTAWRAAVALAACMTLVSAAHADEGGMSFWVPGFFGSLAATPQQPGFSLASIYYHTTVSAGADVAFARQVSRGDITANFNGSVNANINARADLGMAIPSYVFATPVFGAQAALAVAIPFGRSTGTVDATLNGALGPVGVSAAGSLTQSVDGFGDLAPLFSLRWNQGVHNFMTYISGNVPVGNYDSKRIVNLGIGHQALDAGGAYTYFNPQTGHELSGTLGFTYNFENTHTNYQNGVDMHLDMGASQFLTKQLQVGLVGYLYNQLSCDSGAGDHVGCFKSRVAGIGPQLGYVIPFNNGYQGYFNVKGYKEFDAEHRADGWNVWLTFAITPAAPSAAPARMPPIRK